VYAAGAQDHPAQRRGPKGAHLLPKVRCGHLPSAASLAARRMPHPPSTPPLHTHSWAQLDELVVEHLLDQEIEMLKRMGASCRERILLAGVRILVGGTTVVLSGVS